jgi:hypothetical protein
VNADRIQGLQRSSVADAILSVLRGRDGRRGLTLEEIVRAAAPRFTPPFSREVIVGGIERLERSGHVARFDRRGTTVFRLTDEGLAAAPDERSEWGHDAGPRSY